ncbi:MAG: hypothetical protein ABSE15_02500 [Candidatus Bathyarchaeia archaeon]|jgi:DNA-directed RNA polymerase subunit RPC12/RpoP
MAKKQNKYFGTIVLFLSGLLFTAIGVYTILNAQWFGTIIALPFGIFMMAIAIVDRGKIQTVSANTCQDCGAKDSTVQLYMRYGNRTLLGTNIPTMARYLCAKCRTKYELEDKGLRICDHCGETIPLEGKCPNCGAT